MKNIRTVIRQKSPANIADIILQFCMIPHLFAIANFGFDNMQDYMGKSKNLLLIKNFIVLHLKILNASRKIF